MLGKRVLTFDRKCFAVKILIGIEKAAELADKFPSGLLGGFGREAEKAGIENPVYKVVFVLEMVIKAFAVHLAFFADVADRDFFKGLFLHKFLERGGKSLFCYV